MSSAERILVVDDQEVQRNKMALAVKALGYSVEKAEGGGDALLALRAQSFDLILLDILMPEMDGFAVMEFLKKDPKLRDIPVIVISALDTEMGSVVRAIELGAQDFLPKNFDPVLLKARIDSSLEKKRNRDREVEYLNEVRRLTDAAAVLETGIVNPNRLQLADMKQRDDALGQLAGVFTDMAQQVYERERKLRQQIRTLKGVGLLLASGVVTGLGVALARIASSEAPHPFGIVLWVNIICAAICLGSAVYRGKLPKLTPSLVFLFVLWGFLTAIMGEAVVFWVAQHLQASQIALILVSEGFLVFAFASIIRIEKATLRRLLGFVVGLGGVCLVIFATHTVDGVMVWHWMLLAMLAPLGFAVRSIMLTLKLPEDLDMVAATGFSALSSVVLILPIVILKNDFVPLSLNFGAGGGVLVLAILLYGIVSATGVTMRVHLIRSAGAVFASQTSFVITLAGIVWGIVLLGERLPKESWAALVLLVIGLLLVGPKEEAEEVDPITRLDRDHPVDHEL